MPHATTIASPGLQALILCGPGSSFPTFTANPDENPKALLPIANRPMVWYPIDFCYRAGITGGSLQTVLRADRASTDIKLICPPSAAETITSALNTNPFLTSLPHPRPCLLAPSGLDQNTGTAEILGLPEVRAAVKTDFLVLPCDLVCDLSPDKILQAWMVKAASLTDLLSDTRKRPHQPPRSGGLGVWYPTKTAVPLVKGEETDFVATAPLPSSALLPRQKGSLLSDISKVVYAMPTDSLNDLIQEKNGNPVRHALIRRHPRVRMLTSHRDAHIYVFPHWVMRFLAENDRFEAIGEDLVGWWAKAGWQEGLSTKLGLDKVLSRRASKDDEGSTPGDAPSPVGETAHSSPLSSPAPARRGPLDSVTAKDQAAVLKEPGPTINSEKEQGAEAKTPALTVNTSNAHASTVPLPPMLAYVVPPQQLSPTVADPGNNKPGSNQAQAPAPTTTGPLIRRVDTAQLLLLVSLQLAHLPSVEEAAAVSGSAAAPSPFAHARKIAYPEGVRPRANISHGDSLVGEGAAVMERASVRESVVGAGCQVGEGARLHQCLLMDGAVVGAGCRLTRCVLGRRSKIGEACALTDCEVQENLLVEPRTEAKDEKFMSSSGMEASDDEMGGSGDNGEI